MDTTLRKRKRANAVRGMFGAVGVAVLALLATALPTSAHAAEVDAISTVVVNPDKPGAGIGLWNAIEVRATWSAPPGTRAGDSFRLGLPSVISGTPASFALRDGSGDLVGNCEVTVREILCTFSTYVESHDNVSGSLHFSATATTESNEEEWTWTTGTEHEIVTSVPGGVQPNKPVPPRQSAKYSWQSQGGGIAWELNLLGSDLVTPGGNSVTLVDTFDPRLSLSEKDLRVASASREEYILDAWTPLQSGTAAGQYSVSFTGNTFTLQFREPDTTRFYRVSYVTAVPEGVEVGDRFRNSVQASGVDFIESTYVYQTAGGNGGGDERNGAVTWKKVDEFSEPLAGSEWLIVGPTGARTVVVDNGENDENPVEGALEVVGLAWGSYSLAETRSPVGHQRSNDLLPFTVGPGSLNITLGDIENARESGEVSWRKVDPDGAPLGGSEWTLTPAVGGPITVIDDGVNDSDPEPGKVAVIGLDWGEYVLAEVKAPAGFARMQTSIPVTISAETLSVDLGDLVNERDVAPAPSIEAVSESEPLAEGGGQGYLSLACVGLMVVLAGMGVLTWRRLRPVCGKP